MSIHSIQSFAGDVEVPGNLRVVSLTCEDGIAEFGANNATSNVGFVLHRDGAVNSNVAFYYDDVTNELQLGHTLKGGRESVMEIEAGTTLEMNLHGNLTALAYYGDGGGLSNLVTDLQSVTESSDGVSLANGQEGSQTDRTIFLANVTTGANISSNLVVMGNVTASRFRGDGQFLSNIAATLEEIIINGNTTSNIVFFENAHTSFVTTSNVGIANSNPNVTLQVGANVAINDTDDNYKIDVDGNVRANSIHFNTLTLGTNQTLGLEQITYVGNTTPYTVEFDNVNTGWYSTKSCGIGAHPAPADVGTSGLHVDGHLRLGGVAGTDDASELKIRSTAQLLIHGNDTGQDNNYSNVIVKSGGHATAGNASSIEICAAFDEPTRQEINFSTRDTERMTIDAYGNVNVTNNVVAHAFIGDGSKLTGLVTDLQSVTESSDGVSLANGQEGAETDRTIFLANVTTGANVTSNLHVQGNLIIGEVLAVATNTLQSTTDAGPTTTNAITISDSTNAENRATGALKISGGVGIGADAWATNVNAVSYLSVGKETPNGASNVFEVVGDSNVGRLFTTNIVTGHLQINAVSANHSFSLAQVVNTDNEVSSNTINLSNTTASTSTTTGALRVGGGVGIGANLHVGGNVYAQMETSTIASNIVTWDAATGRLTDSAGLISNKLAIVSEVPASALSANTTTLANHGDFVVTASGHQTNYDAWKAFNRTQYIRWNSPIGQYDGASNVFNDTTRLASSTDQGAWIAIEFPYRATLRHLKLTPGVNVQSFPKVAKVYGTNDSLTWTVLKSWSDLAPSTIEDTQTIAVDADDAYKRFALVTTQVAGNYDRVSLEEIKLYTESFTVADGVSNMTNTAISFPKRDGAALSAGDDAVLELKTAHARDSAVLKKYPEVNMQDYRQGGYTASASSDQNIDRVAAGYAPLVIRSAWAAFNGSGTDGFWQLYYPAAPYDGTEPYDANTNSPTITDVDNVEHRGHWIKLELPHKIKVQKMTTNHGDQPERYDSVILLGSNDDTNWYVIKDTFTLPVTSFTSTEINSNIGYKYVLLLIKSLGTSDNNVDLYQLQYYGYEEVGAGDDSVDVTFKSVYNSPDLTNAALYIDGLKGSAATDHSGASVAVTENNVTWDSAEKAWTLTGAATSNIVSGDLASLVGDHPHSVSAWVKADVLNGDGLFHVGTAEGEGDAASRVGFVDDSHISWGGEDHFFSNAEWHNVTYTYNGEGSDKKLYLDGRRVATAKNEDTFGEYPPFAMSTYSEYGYTVSASSDIFSHTGFTAWKAFNNTQGSEGWHTGYNYLTTDTSQIQDAFIADPGGAITTTASATNLSNGTNRPEGGAVLNSSAGNIPGEWLKVELPHKIKLSYAKIVNRTLSNDGQCPKDFKILGSNDDDIWYELIVKQNAGYTAGSTHDEPITNTQNGQNAYKYLAFLCTRINSTSDAALTISEISLYGHKENDLVRFPDSVNVLKYPHITVDEPAKRGYAVSQSSQLLPSTGGSTGYYHGYNVFDREVNIVNRKAWISMNGGNSTPLLYDTNGDPTVAAADTVVDGTTTSGEWVQLKLPHKIKLSYLRLMPPSEGGTTLNRAPKDGVLAGSTDGTTWTAVSSWSGASYSDLQYNTFTANIDSTNSYDYLRLIVKKTGGATLTSIQELEFYGTEEDLDVIARVGDGFDGKIRNLRVYSTALSDARVQEIFDADKDEFGLAKSSVSVYRGHLGVGTTEPKAALTVMDEVGELIQLPPGNMTAHDQYFETHGVFKARTSPGHNTGNYPPWEGFNDTIGTLWYTGYSDSSASYNGTSGAYSGTAQLGSTTKLGEYLVLEMPYKVFPKRMEYIRQSGGSHLITNAYVYGRNGSNGIWTEIGSFTDGGPPDDWVPKVVHLNNSEPYDQLAFVPTKRYAASTSAGVSCHLVRYFGTRERGQSTLHDGQLTLTKNLTVPRIGPPLDADDTPRRDRLVVEYNTSTNPTENGVVNDTSGRGLDGLLDNTYGGAAYNPYYDANEKALVFDGSNDYVFQNDVHLKTGVGGAYSASVWVRNRATSGTQTVYSLGTYTQLTTSTLYVLDTTLQVVFYNSDLSVTYTIPKNTWTNIVVTHAGGPTSTTTKMYINGVDVGLAAVSGTTYPLSTVNFPSPCNLFLGKNSDNSVYGGPMDLSNFKLWDAELSADDAKRLYDMGWSDEGHHTVNFSKTRVGVGLGDGEAPRAELDVRGTARFENITGCGFPSYNKTTWAGVTSTTIPLDPDRFSVHKIFVRGKMTSPTGSAGRTCRIRPKTEGNTAFMSGSMESWSHAHRRGSATTTRAVYDGTDGPLMFGSDWSTAVGTEVNCTFSAEITVYNRFNDGGTCFRSQFVFDAAHTTPYTGIEVVRGACQPNSGLDQQKKIIELSLVFSSSGGTGGPLASGECIICGLN